MRGVAAKLWFWLLDYWQATLWQVQGLRRQPLPQAPETPGTKHIVVIPGIFEPLTFMASLIHDARRAGYVVHGLSVLGYNTSEIPQAAKHVAEYIREHNLGRVTILAHSKGGLIGKYVQALFDAERRIDRMITIATPFSGSALARLLPIRSVREFLPTAETIVQLQQLSSANQRIVSIYGSFDPHIPGGSFLPGAKNICVAAMGHFRILKSPDVRHAVLQNLG
jgi:pimeloyl-ACP methyl ester carboxylesterase